MSTAVEFGLWSDDPELVGLLPDRVVEPVLFWRVAVFVCNQMLERALRAEGVREYHARTAARRAATRASKYADALIEGEPDE